MIMNHNALLRQDSGQGALVMAVVGIFGAGLAYGEVISVDGYFWLILALAGVAILAVQAVRIGQNTVR